MGEVVARSASKCLRLACSQRFAAVALGDVAEVVSGGTPPTDRSEFWGGDIAWVTPKDLGRPRCIEIDTSERTVSRLAIESSRARLLPDGAVLLSSRAPIGHLGIAATALATNQGFKNLICSDDIHNRYLFHSLRGSIDEVAAEGRGNTFVEVSTSIVQRFRVPLPPRPIQEAVARLLDALYLQLAGHTGELPELPPPLAEQRRVVARIEQLAGQIDEARDLRHQAQRASRAMWIQSAGEVFNALLERHPVRTLRELVSLRGGGTPSKFVGHYWEGDIPWITPKDMKVRDINDAQLHISLAATQETPAKIVDSGAVLVVVRGMILVHTCPSGVLRVPAAINQDMKALVVGNELEAEFLCAILQSWNGRIVELVERSTHDTRRLDTGKLLAIEVPVPPRADQRRIVEELNGLRAEVDALTRLQGETAAELDALLPAILDRAFKGELV